MGEAKRAEKRDRGLEVGCGDLGEGEARGGRGWEGVGESTHAEEDT